MAAQQQAAAPVPQIPAVVVFVAAAVLAIGLADKAPKLVNGVLILILVGLVLRNSGAYAGVLAGAQKALGA